MDGEEEKGDLLFDITEFKAEKEVSVTSGEDLVLAKAVLNDYRTFDNNNEIVLNKSYDKSNHIWR